MIINRHRALTAIATMAGIMLAGATTLFAQLDRDALEKERIKENRISEAVQYTHRYKNGQPTKEGYKTTHTYYNAEGNPTMIINYRATGNESSRLYYEYDNQGRRIEYRKEETLGANRMKLSYKQTFTYNSKGQKKTEEGFDGSSQYKIIYNYLPNGKPSDLTRYNADNTISERWIYSYKGNTQIIRITPRNGAPYTVEKVLTRSGQVVSETYLDENNTQYKKIAYTYDAKGRVLTENTQATGRPDQNLQYVFNAQGQLTKVLLKSGNEQQYVNNNYTYDRDGNLITEQWVDGSPSLISQKDNAFDEQGDMVKVESFYAPYNYRVMYSYEYKKR